MATQNINLDEVALSNTFGQFVEMFNGNMGKLDSMPLPIEYGKNTKFEYIKFANGIVALYGRVEMGTKYPCTLPWGSDGYASGVFTLNFPVTLTNSNPVVIPHVISSVGSGESPKNTDIWCYTSNITYTTYDGRFVSRNATSAGANSLSLNMLIIGKWK